MTPDKPFFVYFATGATHAPHHVPQEWIERFHSQFDSGWDAVRAATYERQKQAGIIPGGTKLPPRPEDIAAWDSLSEDHKRVFRRQAEVFAAFVAHTDHHIGRFVKAIEDIGELDNTLVFYIAGDNGTSAEGGMVGMYNEMTYFNGVEEKVKDLLPLIDKWGSKETFPHMAAGWAVAFDAPFKWTKQVASDFGGTRNGLVVHWPKGIKQGGGLRTQFGHVIDVAPTILDAAGLPEPKVVNGVPQVPIEGTSLLYAFDDAGASERHTTQYFEMFGNRAIYRDGWLARTIHRAPWQITDLPPLDTDPWELYHVAKDFSLADDLASKHPKKLEDMKALFMTEAAKYHVLPIDDRTIERTNATLAGRPDLMGGRTSLTLYEGMEGMLENTFINVKNRSKTVTAEIEIPEGGASGAILVQGGRFGGWSLHLREGKPAYEYNWLGMERFVVESPSALSPGKATVKLEFAYAGGGRGKGGTATLSVNGRQVAEGRIGKTQPNIFSADETADVGIDNQTPVALGIGYGPEETRFTGRIHKVVVEVK
jgi:arylsulfatase